MLNAVIIFMVCVSYYKGNLGKESCTYMKAYKK